MVSKITNSRQYIMTWRNAIRERYIAKAMEIAEEENQTGVRAREELYHQLDQIKNDLDRASAALEYIPEV